MDTVLMQLQAGREVAVIAPNSSSS
jgi:hypothetical protein